ncbi:unnamed protein product, partial [Symbiodinium microadriaticum]
YLQPDGRTLGSRETAQLPARWQQEPLAPTPPGSLLPAPPEKARPRVACTACWLVDGYGALESSSFLEDQQLFWELRDFGEELKQNDFHRAALQRAAYTANKAAAAREHRWRHNERPTGSKGLRSYVR